MKKVIQSMKEKKVQKRKSGYLKRQRLMDIYISTIALFLLFPLLITITIVILLKEGKPVFFKQARTGINGSEFEMLKFRTMKPIEKQTNVKKYEYSWNEGIPHDFIFKGTNSNKNNITKIGRLLRKYSLDELPQIINVLKGEMSIVGPRPEIPELSKYYNEIQKQRLNVKPGITGWAQVNGRAELLHGEKIKYDLEFVNKQSIANDIKIIIITIFQAINGKGSY